MQDFHKHPAKPTKTTKTRPKRRLLSVVLSLLLGASVLAGVTSLTSSPVSAANTASEALHDHDSNPETPPQRQFAGANRYATSLELARAFVSSAGAGGGFADTLILASGDNLVDAAAAAGLSAARSAPVILTAADRLSRAVKNFIADEFIAEIIILGGTDAVSQAIENDLEEIETVSTITRLAGADRYATSALVAAEASNTGEYCDTGAVSAVIVNVDSSFADVVAAGPLAYAQELPILLTAADRLPDEVVDYLTQAETEHVVVVGGTTAVSEEVVEEIFDAGVSDVTRIAGENRFATAVAVLEALANCEGVTLSASTLALVNADTAADGVAAAPLLGLGLDSTAEGVTPALLVTASELPTETLDYLSALPVRNAAGSYVDVQISAIGGLGVIPNEVVQAAIDAATTSQPLTATIRTNNQGFFSTPEIFVHPFNLPPLDDVEVNSSQVQVHFSSPVNMARRPTDPTNAAAVAAFATSALNPAHYTVNGNPLVAGDRVFAPPHALRFTLTPSVAGNVVIVAISDYELAAGDVIAVAGGKISGIASSGIGRDNRRVTAMEFIVPEAVSDNLRPRIQIFAPANGHEFRISATDPNLDRFDELTRLTINNRPLTEVLPDGVTLRNVAHRSTDPARVETDDIVLRTTVCLFGLDPAATASLGYNSPALCQTTPPEGHRTLRAGDVIAVGPGAFTDQAGNESRTTLVRVSANSAKPTLIRATVSEPVPHDANGPAVTGGERVSAYRWWDFDGPNNGVCPANDRGCAQVTYLQIYAKPGGAADGADGNGWLVDWYKLPDDDDDTPEAVSNVLERRKIIRIGFDDDATLHAVVLSLLANEEITKNFNVNSDALANPSLGSTALAGRADLNCAFPEQDGVRRFVLGCSAGDSGFDVFDPANFLTRFRSQNEFGKPSSLPATFECPPAATCAGGVVASAVSEGSMGTLFPVIASGEHIVTVTLTYNDVLNSFDYSSLRTANARPEGSPVGQGNFPLAEDWLEEVVAGTTSPIFPNRLVNTISFTVHSANLADLPQPGDTITLPAGLATNYDDAASDAAQVRLRPG